MAAWGLIMSRVTVIYELVRGDPKYLVRLDKLINSSESAKQSLRMEDESLVSPKEYGTKGVKVKKQSLLYNH